MGPHYERDLLAGRRTYLPLSRTALTQQFWVRAPKFRRPCKLHQRRAKSAAVGVTASLIGSDQFSVLRNYVLVSHYPFLGDVFLVDLAAALKLTKKSAMRACVEKFQRSARPHCRQKCPPTGGTSCAWLSVLFGRDAQERRKISDWFGRLPLFI